MQIATHAITWIFSRLHREEGQDLIEYAMLSGLIAAAIVAVGILIYSGALTSMATGISNCIDFSAASACNPGF
jgi:Flp pilus assembly pilin Flp